MHSHLLSLELQGYKTFANQTPFEFPGTVTAIVGPNGSGKSNIADAIRWVLGEQSYSLLRAKKTVDMIFSGSEQRPRAGMASVSITFNNEDNWLPIDYSEVVLTRRAYRDGQNEYLINNQKVRLRDVHELLAQTGLADRTYTIIGQGLVDVALAIRPDERRRLFEEAAGIGLYRLRKEETLRRLDNARRNLDRVLDIMAEIKPRLRSLERQSSKATEYKQLQSDLKVLLRDWYGYYWFKSQKEIRAVQQLCNEQERFLEESHRKQSANQVALDINRHDMQIHRDELNSLHQELAQLHSKIGHFGRDLAVLDERKRAVISRRSQLELDIANTEEKIKSREITKQSIIIEFDQLSKEFEEADRQLSDINNQVVLRMQERQSLESAIEKIRNERMESETSIIKISARKTEFSERINDLKLNINQSQKSIKELESKKEGLESDKNRLNLQVPAFEKKVTDLTEQIAEANDKLTNLLNNHTNQEKKLSDLINEQTRLSVQLEMLLQSEQALAGFSEGAKALLKYSKSKASKYDLSALSKQIIVPKRYEVALNAALGEFVDLLIIKNPSINLQILKHLENKVINRVAITAQIKNIAVEHEISFSNTKGIIGNAIDLIEVSEEIKPIMAVLLVNTLVVENKAQAVSLLKELPENYKIVTLDGEVFLSNGIVFLGKLSSNSKIGATRQKLEIKQHIESLEERISKVKTNLTLLQGDISNVNIALTNLEEEKNNNNVQLDDLNRRKSSVELEIDKVDDQTSWLINQIKIFSKKIKESTVYLTELDEGIKKESDKVQKCQTQEQEQKSLLSDLPVNDLHNQLHQLETAAAVSKQAFKSCEDKLKTIKDDLDEELAQLDNLHNRYTEACNLIDEIQQEELVLREREADITSQADRMVTDKIKPLEETLSTVGLKYDESQKLEKKLQKEYVQRERQFTQVQLDLTRKQEKLELLNERIKDDFGLVDFEYEQDISGPTPLPFQDMVIESLPVKHELPDNLGANIKELKSQMRRIGSVNPEAQSEYIEVQERFEFLQNQVKDLESASDDLRKVISELDEIMQREFIKTFKAVSSEFSKMFARLFNGGTAHLMISDEKDPIESGIDIEARLPGRREQGLALLSGGERSLAAVALVFALLKVSPTPFCVLDEVDAMLDESNVTRFCELLKELSSNTQFVVITHNRSTVQAADVIYGITMGRDTASQVISLKLDEVDETYIE